MGTQMDQGVGGRWSKEDAAALPMATSLHRAKPDACTLGVSPAG